MSTYTEFILTLSSFERRKIFLAFLSDWGRKKYNRNPIAIHSIEYIISPFSAVASPRLKFAEKNKSTRIKTVLVVVYEEEKKKFR